MNLAITDNADQIYQQFKINKKVATAATPYVVMFEIQGESIEATWNLTPEKDSITPENWLANVWNPLTERLTTNYAKLPCYVVVEVVYTNTEGNLNSQPVLFKWCPEQGVPVKAKMMIGSAFQALKRKLDLLNNTPELGSAADLNINKFADQAKLKAFPQM